MQCTHKPVRTRVRHRFRRIERGSTQFLLSTTTTCFSSGWVCVPDNAVYDSDPWLLLLFCCRRSLIRQFFLFFGILNGQRTSQIISHWYGYFSFQSQTTRWIVSQSIIEDVCKMFWKNRNIGRLESDYTNQFWTCYPPPFPTREMNIKVIRELKNALDRKGCWFRFSNTRRWRDWKRKTGNFVFLIRLQFVPFLLARKVGHGIFNKSREAAAHLTY